MASSTLSVWRARHVLRFLVRRDLAVKYQQSLMGYLWSLIEPLAMGLIYYFVFILIMGRGARLAHIDPYFVYLMAGIFSFMWTNGVLSEATRSLTGQSNLITTMRVPREVFPVARVAARFAEFAAGLPILFVFAMIFRAPFTWYLLLIPAAVLLQTVFLIGIALLLSAVNVMLRDIERFMRLIHRLVFYSTPIIYPLSMVHDSDMPQWVKTVYQANPLVGILELHHAAWFPDLFPSTSLLVTSVVGSLATLLLGWWVFRRLEPAVLKEL